MKDLLVRGDPYNMKEDLCGNIKHGYVKCNKKCDSCDNYVDETSYLTSNATGRRFKISRDSSCASKNVIYVAYCKHCGKQ